MANDKTYKVNIHCLNCSYGNTLETEGKIVLYVPCGTLAHEFLLHQICPECGCKTLKQDFERRG